MYPPEIKLLGDSHLGIDSFVSKKRYTASNTQDYLFYPTYPTIDISKIIHSLCQKIFAKIRKKFLNEDVQEIVT